MPGATWIGPTGNRNAGAELTVYGLVLHIQQGTEAGTEAWQRNPASQVSSHFLLPQAGGARQMVDTADRAWAQAAGNGHWLSAECEGRSGHPLTDAQVHSAAQILAWGHETYGVPLRVANDANAASVASGGLGYHAMGGTAWGNHPDCPGTPVISQRPAIVAQAVALLTGGSMDLDYNTTYQRPDVVGTRPARVEVDDVWAHEMTGVGPYGPEKSFRGAQLDRIEAALTALGVQLKKLAGPANARDIAAEIIKQLGASG